MDQLIAGEDVAPFQHLLARKGVNRRSRGRLLKLQIALLDHASKAKACGRCMADYLCHRASKLTLLTGKVHAPWAKAVLKCRLRRRAS